MEKQKNYHHGGLKDKLISNLLLAIENNTLESFSIREFSRSIGVSPAAPYNHFKDKEDLIYNALLYSRKDFLDYLVSEKDVEENETSELISLGKKYLFFAYKNPKIFDFIFSNKITLKINDNFYKDINDVFMSVIQNNIDTENFRTRVSIDTSVKAAWSMVHGIACLIANRSIDIDEINGYIEGKLFDELSAIWAVGVSKPPKLR